MATAVGVDGSSRGYLAQLCPPWAPASACALIQVSPPPLNGRQISASKTFSSPPQLLFTVVSAAPGRLIAVQCISSSGPVYPMATGCPWGGGGNVSALVSALSHGPCTMIEQPVDLGSFVSYSSC
jgi:hypothetical protein